MIFLCNYEEFYILDLYKGKLSRQMSPADHMVLVRKITGQLTR